MRSFVNSVAGSVYLRGIFRTLLTYMEGRRHLCGELEKMLNMEREKMVKRLGAPRRI